MQNLRPHQVKLLLLIIWGVCTLHFTAQAQVTNITVSNISSCNNGTYTANVLVNVSSQYVTVTLTGPNLVGSPPSLYSGLSFGVTFYSVQLKADGAPITLTATLPSGNFLTKNNLGTAPAFCCTTPSLTIAATPSLTITSGSSITLTTSGADSYTWSNGSTANPLIVSNVTSATAFSVTGVTGTCSATATAAVSVTTVNNLPVDLTPTLTLPQANFAASGAEATHNFSISLFEVNGKPTSNGTIVLTVTVPVGYTIAFDNAITSINVTGGLNNPVSVGNTNWTQTNSVDDRQLTLTIKAGQGIPANGQINLGLSITRTTANAGSTSNITVNITNDGGSTYDGNAANNVYARVINGL